MKKIFTFLFVALFCFLMTACGDDSGKMPPSDPAVLPSGDAADLGGESVADGKQDTDIYTWPVFAFATQSVSDAEKQLFQISMPTDIGSRLTYGRCSLAKDGTKIYCYALPFNNTIQSDSPEQAFEDYMEYLLHEVAKASDGEDFAFTVTSKESKQINGIDMCKFEGTHTHNLVNYNTSEKTPVSQYYAAYAARLSRGGYVFWVAIDVSDDQSLKDVVNYDVDTMATTLIETD